jgi:hypothetical protein
LDVSLSGLASSAHLCASGKFYNFNKKIEDRT